MGNVHMEATQINYREGGTKKSVAQAIKDATELTPEQKADINKIPTIEAAVATKAAQSIIAPEFDSEAGVYAIGDLVMHEGKLYEFTTAHETAGEWDSTEVTEKTVADEIGSVKSGLINQTARTRSNITSFLTNLTTAIAEQNLEKYGYKIGDYFIGNSGYKYYLADYDTFYSGYSGYSNTDIHHIGVVVDTGDTSAWQADGTLTSYVDSDLNTMLTGTVLNNIKSDMLLLFGGETGTEHLIGTRKLYTKLNDSSEWTWSQYGSENVIYICAMTEMQIYGSKLLSVSNYEQGEGCKHLKIFDKFKWTEIYGDYDVWLRSIASSTEACSADGRGNAAIHSATRVSRVSGLILFH